MKIRLIRATAMMAAVALLVAACGSETGGEASDTPAPETSAAPDTTESGDLGDDTAETSQWGIPVVDPLDVDAGVDVGIAGSSTVFPLSTAVLSQWIDEGGPEYSIDSIGSGVASSDSASRAHPTSPTRVGRSSPKKSSPATRSA